MANQIKDKEIDYSDDLIVQSLKEKINKYNFINELLPNFENGGEIDPPKYKAEKEWLRNWYVNRQVNDKYDIDRENIVKIANNLPDPVMVKDISGNPRARGGYNKNTGEILMINDTPNIYLHEANHKLQNFNEDINKIHSKVVRDNIIKKEFLPENYQKSYNYLSNPDEVHSRLQVLRRDAGFKPNQKVTPEDIENYLEKYNGKEPQIDELIELFDDRGLEQILNKMVYTSLPVNINYT